jgi:hypothetical protein
VNRFICSRNIERYRRLLENEPSGDRRVMLAQLLADEEQIWRAFYADGDDGRNTLGVRQKHS